MKTGLLTFFLFITWFAVPLTGTAKTYSLSTPSGGDFSLPLAGHKKFNTSELRGSNLFIVFGFTHCKSVCPLTLNRLKSTYSLLSREDKKNVKVLFVSVDNERDNLEALKNYVTAFDSSFLSGTTNDKDLKKILERFGARYYRYKTKNKNILVDHTSDIYVINKKGVWADTLSFDASPEDLLGSLKKSDSIENFEQRFPNSRQLELIKPAKPCIFENAQCELNILKNKFTLSLSEFPLKTDKKFSVQLKTCHSDSELVPVEGDFTGVELYMGYIRPSFKSVDPSLYALEVSLPVCELKKMNWLLTLVFKHKNGHHYATQVKLKTEDL